MKKFIVLTLFITNFVLSANAQTTFSTFTPFSPQQAYKFNSNLYNRYLPPNKQYLPPPPPNYNRRYNKFSYYDPYYTQNKKWRKFKNFFSSGQMTGYTPSYNSAFDTDNNPYGYQSGYYDSFGNYHQNNYDQQNGMSIKILD